MPPRVLIPLAPGCEELEAVTLIDLLRRAGIEVISAGLQPGPVKASRGTVLLPDTELDAVLAQHFDLIALPGGLPGADHLTADLRLRGMLQAAVRAGRSVAAICAAPKALAAAGLLDGRQATGYPGVLEAIREAGDGGDFQLSTEPVVSDGPVVTSRGPGSAMDFALALIERLSGPEARERVESGLVRP